MQNFHPGAGVPEKIVARNEGDWIGCLVAVLLCCRKIYALWTVGRHPLLDAPQRRLRNNQHGPAPSLTQSVLMLMPPADAMPVAGGYHQLPPKPLVTRSTSSSMS